LPFHNVTYKATITTATTYGFSLPDLFSRYYFGLGWIPPNMSFREKLLGISEARFLQAGCPPVTTTNSIKALKKKAKL